MNIHIGSSRSVPSTTTPRPRSGISGGFARISAIARKCVGLAVLFLWACDSSVGITGLDRVNRMDPMSDLLVTLTLDTTEVRVFEGQARQLELTVRRGGTVVNPATSGLTIAWRSEDPSIASVDTKGLLEGLAEGQVRIVASSQGVEVSASVTVAPGAQYVEILSRDVL